MSYHPEFDECGKRIQRCRLERKMTQEDLAEKLNISANMIAKIECGLRKPSIDIIVAVSEIFGKTLDYLLLGKEPEDRLDLTDEDVEKEIDRILQEAKEHILYGK